MSNLEAAGIGAFLLFAGFFAGLLACAVLAGGARGTCERCGDPVILPGRDENGPEI